MVRVDFEALIKEASAYFERTKAPAVKTMDLWFDELRYMSHKSLTHLLTELKNLEAWPRNLPLFLKAKYAEWAEKEGVDNPNKIHPRRFNPQRYAKPNCQKCAGKGLVRLDLNWPMRRTEEGLLITRKVKPWALCSCSDEVEYGF